jgi:hypothetical protein
VKVVSCEMLTLLEQAIEKGIAAAEESGLGGEVRFVVVVVVLLMLLWSSTCLTSPLQIKKAKLGDRMKKGMAQVSLFFLRSFFFCCSASSSLSVCLFVLSFPSLLRSVDVRLCRKSPQVRVGRARPRR